MVSLFASCNTNREMPRFWISLLSPESIFLLPKTTSCSIQSLDGHYQKTPIPQKWLKKSFHLQLVESKLGTAENHSGNPNLMWSRLVINKKLISLTYRKIHFVLYASIKNWVSITRKDTDDEIELLSPM